MYRIIYLLLGLVFSWNTAFAIHSGGSPDESSPGETELRIALRDLWTGHVFWVRSVVLSSHYEDADATESAETEVVENARALADAITPFYGNEAADQLFGLLAGHYGAIKGYLNASLSDDGAGTTASSAELTENARAIATFLDAANPHLPKSAVLPLLLAHGGHHIRQIDLVDSGDFDGEAGVWEEMLVHVHKIADAMAGALAKQFPAKVTG